jgi:cation transport ATPase
VPLGTLASYCLESPASNPSRVSVSARRVEGERIEIGADRYMRKLGLDVDPFARTAERLGGEGKSPLYAAIGGRVAAIVAVADPISRRRQKPSPHCTSSASGSL